MEGFGWILGSRRRSTRRRSVNLQRSEQRVRTVKFKGVILRWYALFCTWILISWLVVFGAGVDIGTGCAWTSPTSWSCSPLWVGFVKWAGTNKGFQFLRKTGRIHKPVIEDFNGRLIKSWEMSFHAMQNITCCDPNSGNGEGLWGFKQGWDILGRGGDWRQWCIQWHGQYRFEDQTTATPGSIHVSEVIRDNVSNKNDVKQFVKTETLKNVKEYCSCLPVETDGTGFD